jgi:hypothetical protein
MNFKNWTLKKIMGGIMLFKKSPQASEYSGLKLIPKLGVLSAALLLASCGADVSDETAMQESLEVSLAQCEILQYGVVGTATDPVLVNGEEVNACVLSTDFGHFRNSLNARGTMNNITLKASWNYKPLVWVLDGVYEFGESKEYRTLNDLIADRKNFSIGSSVSSVYAKENTVVIVHRNAQLSATIQSLDDNLSGGGEWGGVIINGIGYSPECPATSSPDELCNVKGAFGYYGGVSADTNLIDYGMVLNTSTVYGAPGLYYDNAVIGEAGATAEVVLEGYAGGIINAAVTAYAPALGQIGSVIGYSGNTGIEIHGGSLNLNRETFTGSLPTPFVTQAAGSSVELNDYDGEFSARVRHVNNVTAVKVSGGHVEFTNTTLYDQYNQAGNALELIGAATLSVDDMVIQGFDTCLAPQDSASQISVGSALFNCSNVTNNTSNALAAIADATDLITGADALLSYIWAVGNSSLNFANVEDPSQLGAGNARVEGVYSQAILFPECMGVGTLAEDTLLVGSMRYQICDLTNVDQSATLYSNFSIEGRLDNGGKPDYYPKNIAWRINGQVLIGTVFTPLNSAEQAAALASPVQLTVPAGTTLLATSNNDSELLIQPDARLRVAGSADAPVALGVAGLTAGDITSGWRGITVNGADGSVKQLDIQYLRLYDTGEDGQAAFTLNEVGADSNITYLDIYGAGADGLNINGGAANFNHLVMANIAGDQIQWQNGYQGTIETAVISPGDNSTGAVLHGINNNADYDAIPRSRPVITNITAAGFGSANTAVLLEQGSGLLMFNSVFSDFATCLDIDDAETAALQSSDPLGILFDGVIFSCENTLADESESGGYDYGYTVVSAGGVVEEDPVLNTGYLITGNVSVSLVDLSNYAALLGDAYHHLGGGAYIGAVADDGDDWYSNWSDSVVIAPDFECNNLGMMVGADLYLMDYRNQVDVDINGDGAVERGYAAQITCRILGGTYTEDRTLSKYTGLAGEAVASAIEAGETDMTSVLAPGYIVLGSNTNNIYWIDEPIVPVVPTTWTVKGEIHIGKGHQQITDVAAIADMKANPVTLTIDAGVVLTAESDNSVLHITRAGYLNMRGEAEFKDSNDNPEDTKGYIELDIPLVIDGFARHNQCPEAATAEAGTRICNIQGQYGYYGGYDNDFVNFDMRYFYHNSTLRLNATGSATIDNSIFRNSSDAGEEYTGVDQISIDGGSTNFTHLYQESSRGHWGSFLYWNHGYQGTLQYISANPTFAYGSSYHPDPVLMDESGQILYPLLRGDNVTDAELLEAGSLVALPRSMPTIANMTIAIYEFAEYEQVSPAVGLGNETGLFIYNSAFGTSERFMDRGRNFDLCFYIDETIKPQLDDTLVVNNLAANCKAFSNNPDGGGNLVDLLAVSDTSSFKHYYAALSGKGPGNYDGGVVSGVTAAPKNSDYYPAPEVMKGPDLIWNASVDTWLLDYSSSKTVNIDVVGDNTYMGAFDYSLVLDAGEDITD